MGTFVGWWQPAKKPAHYLDCWHTVKLSLVLGGEVCKIHQMHSVYKISFLSHVWRMERQQFYDGKKYNLCTLFKACHLIPLRHLLTPKFSLNEEDLKLTLCKNLNENWKYHCVALWMSSSASIGGGAFVVLAVAQLCMWESKRVCALVVEELALWETKKLAFIHLLPLLQRYNQLQRNCRPPKLTHSTTYNIANI